jgi:peptide/nickel transport system ATP-binding protein
VLAVEDLHVDLPGRSGMTKVVRGVSLSVAAGQTLAIVGESGSGKSITALSIMGLLPAGARRQVGRLAFEGDNLDAFSDRRMEDVRGRRIGMIFQDPTASFNPSLRIGQQLEEVHLRHVRAGRRAARDRAIELLERVGMPAPEMRMSQYPFELSGGLRQRAMIAMALMCNPSLVIADEPTTALDVTVQAQVLRVLRDLQQQMQIALVLITHDLGVVSVMADEVAVMYAGQIVEQAPAGDLFTAPRHPYTRGLIRCIPRIDAESGAHRLPSIRGSVPNLATLGAGCSFADRCDMALPACRQAPIPLQSRAGNRASRCLRADELELADA